ncbi:MAG: endonuclease [Paludibacter sp.]|nr:endonuclease [Paludibacter sp.]
MKSFLKIYLFAVLFVAYAVVCQATIPTGYYTTANGKTKAELKTALYNIVKKHTQLEYYSSSTYFLTTDWNPAGYIWDMYSNFKRPTWTGMNREHSLPKSWWSAAPETTVAYSDLHNLYPSDATANSAKLNYGLGEVTGTPEYTNGVIKVGANGFPGYTGTVFEPADEYKGDFARDYMYVVTSYENYANNWRSIGTASMLLGGTYPIFRPWAIELLLKWHRNDPVSDKEINRNNAVYGFQNNRNPFIDHPELAEYIWGKYMGQNWEEGAEPPQDEIALVIQPNPVDNELKVKINNPEKAVFYIRSLSGITFKTGKFSAEGTVAVDDLRNGMYILVVYSGTKRIVSKFVLHHE